MTATSRIQWLDTCKGIGIFLVIIGHTMISPSYRSQIFAFHMPLFFFISGYLFSIKKYKKLSEVVFSKSKSLLVPYICFSFISIILMRILLHQPIEITAFIKAMVISKRNGIYYDDPLWFLTSLFSIEILYFLLLKYLKKDYLILIVIVILSYFSLNKLNVLAGAHILPWSFDQSLYFILYFGLGNIAKNIGFLKNNLKKSMVLIVVSVVYILLLLDPNLYNKILDSLNTYLHVPMSIVTFINVVLWAFIAITFVIYLSQYLSYVAYINFLGRSSLILLALHVSLGFNLINRVAGTHLSVIKDPNLLGLAFTIGAIVIITPVILLINRYFSFILGKGLPTINQKKAPNL